MPVELWTRTIPASVPSPAHAAGADPQGGRFHLLAGESDWRACDAVDAASKFEFDTDSGSLRLAHRDAVTRHSTSTVVRGAHERRGADRDRYGSWYWIAADRRGIMCLGPGATQAAAWWSLDDLDESCAANQGPAGTFGPASSATVTSDARLAGLAITTGHRLAVGLVDDRGGLVLFDLHARGVPLVLRWPGDDELTPFDLAATADGGMLVLDRIRRTWWRLDRNWRVRAEVAAAPPPPFQAADATLPAQPTFDPTIVPLGNTLPVGGPDAVADPVAIAEGAGVIVVLDRPPDGPSAIVVCDPAAPSGVIARVPLTVLALDPARPDLPAFGHDVVGHDVAFGPSNTSKPLPGPLLYIADASTSSTEAYALSLDPPTITHQPDELPMRSWEAKAIVASGGDVFYDAVGRWVPLEAFGLCNMERSGTLRTPSGFVDQPVAGQPFDSVIAGCVWHRLFIDAEIPDGCSIHVGARAADDPALLEQLPFLPQPMLYLRGAGAELPWHDPWVGVRRRPTSARTGTWELLFQHVVGRYVQLELSLAGTGRSSPALRALRVWYPRFSYVRAYLPELYEEEDEPARFLERLLANMEGLLTDHESRIDQAWMLADARRAPAEALDWLASWVGLHLEPAWTTDRRRFLLRNVERMYRARGTVGGLRALLRVYLGCSLDDDVVFAPAPRSDDPARIVDLVGAHRFRVLIPAKLDSDRADMVACIVRAARPAHASFEIRSWTGLLVVGEAQVGIDTLVGESPAFVPYVLDSTDLAAGVLGAPHPFEIADRIVSDRDRLAELPAL